GTPAVAEPPRRRPGSRAPWRRDDPAPARVLADRLPDRSPARRPVLAQCAVADRPLEPGRRGLHPGPPRGLGHFHGLCPREAPRLYAGLAFLVSPRRAGALPASHASAADRRLELGARRREKSGDDFELYRRNLQHNLAPHPSRPRPACGLDRLARRAGSAQRSAPKLRPVVAGRGRRRATPVRVLPAEELSPPARCGGSRLAAVAPRGPPNPADVQSDRLVHSQLLPDGGRMDRRGGLRVAAGARSHQNRPGLPPSSLLGPVPDLDAARIACGPVARLRAGG